MNKYKEFNILGNDKTEIYMEILEILFNESRDLKLKLSLEELYSKMSNIRHYEYFIDDLEKDLKYLMKTGNVKCQDENPFGIRTLEEYKNRKKYYSITITGIAAFRAIQEFYQSLHQSKIISKDYFIRIHEDIIKFPKMIEKSNIRLFRDWWDIFVNDCMKLFQSYQDYINTFDSDEFNMLSDKAEFMNYKDEFMSDLNEMISKLSENARLVSNELKAVAPIIEKQISQLEIYDKKLQSKFKTLSEEDKQIIHNNYWNKWINIKSWFLYNNGQPIYLSILEYSSQIIGKIVKKTNILTQMDIQKNQNEELLNDIKRFHECMSLEECDQLFLKLYGVKHMVHIQSDHQEADLNDDFSTGKKLIYQFEKNSRNKTGRLQNEFTVDRRESEKIAFEKMKEQMDLEKSLLNLCDNNKKLDLSNIRKILKNEEIFLLLKWLSSGLGGVGQTDNGVKYSLKRDNKNRITLETESGQLELENFILDFEV